MFCDLCDSVILVWVSIEILSSNNNKVILCTGHQSKFYLFIIEKTVRFLKKTFIALHTNTIQERTTKISTAFQRIVVEFVVEFVRAYLGAPVAIDRV